MDLERARLFRDIAQTRSVSKGSKLNNISQSAASQHLQDLEEQLGLTLLDRGSRPLMVTDAGKLYLEMCRDLLQRQDEFQAALERMKTEVEGTVRVASIYSVGLSEMSQLEREFSRRYPEAHLEVEYLRPEKVYEAVVTDHADLGLLSYPEATKEVTVLPWRQEEMVVAASPYHPLAEKSEVRPEDLDGLDFVGFDDDLPIRRDIDRFLRDHHVQVNLTLHFDNLQMIKEAVAHGEGVSIMPARIMEEEVKQGRLVPIPIASLQLYRPVGIVHRRKKRFHRAGQAFLELLREPPAGWTPALSGA
ncbi:MAG TPA: LysR family transcriptional regulator [Bryobacteraceae bacterium]|jgi:DNA-binding transcriptional LysR family regulator|nr:LysR family transcriptional regulator [Bryobacteraceae bacterium]